MMKTSCLSPVVGVFILFAYGNAAFVILAPPRSTLLLQRRINCPSIVRSISSTIEETEADRENAAKEECFDAIVVGSGMGSLVAGNILAQHNRRVLMLENHAIPGGFTTNFYRKGYRFEVSTHTITGCEDGGAVGDLLHELNIDKKDIEFIPLKEFMRWINPARNIDYVVPLPLSEHIQKLSDLFPSQEAGIRKFYNLYYPVVDFVLKFQHKRGLDKALWVLGNIPTLLRFLALKGKTAADILDPLVKDPACRDIMTIMTLIFGLDYTEIDAPIYLFGSMGPHAEGAYYPKGGSGKFSRVLANHFCQLGGQLRLKTHVDKILFDSNRAVGVWTTDRAGKSSMIRGKCIVVGCDINALITQLCPPGMLPEKFVNNILDKTPGRSAVQVWAGLDLDLREYGITTFEVLRNNEIQQTPKLIDYISRTADYANIPFTGVTVYSNIDPTCCPSGKSAVLSIYIASEEAFEHSLGPDGEHGEAYNDLKDRIREQFIGHISRALDIPDLAEHVEVVEVATPITFKRYTGHREGSFMGWKLSPDQGAFSSRPEQSPVAGLFLCGQWVGFGGVSNVMTTGLQAGKMAHRYLQRRENEEELTAIHT